MGLLDDAIREHLELKRRHGADPSEVERQEHEALGPARRSAAPRRRIVRFFPAIEIVILSTSGSSGNSWRSFSTSV